MNMGLDALTVFVFLLPGFLSSVLLDCVAVRKEQETLGRVTEALIFSFLNYVAIAAFSGKSPVLMTSTKVGEVTSYAVKYNGGVVLAVAALAVLLPLVIGFLLNSDLHMKALRKLRLTRKTSRGNVWLDVFSDGRRSVIVNLSDGRRIFGYPLHYATSPEEGLIYLTQAAWIEEDGDYLDLEGAHGILLVKEKNIDSVEFFDTPEVSEEPEADAVRE